MADLLISVGDYVIVQDGVIDQPKIVVWEDVTALDVVVSFSNDMLISVFDNILAQDSPAVQPALVSMAIVVFDNVVVQEGFVDSNLVAIFALEDVTVTDTGTITFTR